MLRDLIQDLLSRLPQRKAKNPFGSYEDVEDALNRLKAFVEEDYLNVEGSFEELIKVKKHMIELKKQERALEGVLRGALTPFYNQLIEKAMDSKGETDVN
jgi:hypothetical protein